MRTLRTPLLALFTLGACGSPDPEAAELQAAADAGLGRCQMEQPATTPEYGATVYDVTQALPASATQSKGRYAILLSCTTDGPAGTQLTLMLPNLSDSVPATGNYAIRIPGLENDTSTHVAWASAMYPNSRPDEYRGVGGSVQITEVAPGALIGSYYVALSSANAATDTTSKLVVGGSFAAPRNTIDTTRAAD